jgi:translation initiation factor IF-1
MDLYAVSLATGAVGLGIMAVGGLSHITHAGHIHGARGGAAHGTHSGATTARVPGIARSGARGVRATSTGGSGWRWTSLLSPRLLFSFFVGFGAGGILATPLNEPLRLVAAVAAGVAFEALLVGPLWRFLFRFESREASTLETAIEDEARAVTTFDANGNGLVALELDGQLVQLLATLASDERARGVRIRSGDLVRIAEVDAARGRCTVTQPTR